MGICPLVDFDRAVKGEPGLARLAFFVLSREVLMSHGMKHQIMHALGHGARHEREKGNSESATGLTMVGIGMALMPIPIVGLPLMLWGGVKAIKGFKKHKDDDPSGH